MNTIEKIEQNEMARISEGRELPDFGPGDTLKVDVKIKEGTRERVQAFEGVCISRTSRGVNSSFTVRKISYGEGVERVFPLHSPMVDGVTVIRRGRVRRAKLYFLRGLTGKAARIAEKQDFHRTKAKAEKAEKAATAAKAAKATKATKAAKAAETTDSK